MKTLRYQLVQIALLLIYFIANASGSVEQDLGKLGVKLRGLQDNLGLLKGSLGDLTNSVQGILQEAVLKKQQELKLKIDKVDQNLARLARGKITADEAAYYEQLVYFSDQAKVLFRKLDTIDPIDKALLADYAEVGGYGYKTANLTKLNEFVGQIYQHCKIPEFAGISDGEIKAYLRANGFNVLERWKTFLTTLGLGNQNMIKAARNQEWLAAVDLLFRDTDNFAAKRQALSTAIAAGNDSSRNEALKEFFPIQDAMIDFLVPSRIASILQTGQYPANFLVQLKTQFEEQINRVFQSQILPTSGLEVDRLLTVFTPSFKPNTNASIRRVHALLTLPTKRLMVRSTGKEDTDKLANAGGNESIANVTSQPADIFRAIGEVVVSYFMEKSMQQRLGAKDPSLFDVPFTPVLIQRMIGETPRSLSLSAAAAQAIPGNEITRCGVMFTEEPEGGIAVKGEKWSNGKVKTSGITIIQASYGHNEGVVNSLVPVDTYYIGNDNTIHYVVKNKTRRKTPAAANAENKKLFDLPNPSSLVGVPALTKEEIKQLKRIANALEHYYQQPMDVEFVIDYSVDPHVIYIVQARPIVHNQQRKKPSYLVPELFDEADHAFDAFRGKMKNMQDKLDAIGVGGGATRIITDFDHCIMSKTIGEALTINNNSPKKLQIEGVVVNEMAPATSHEATTFRGENKPVLCASDDAAYKKVIAMKQAPGDTLVVDPQQGVVMQLQGALSAAEVQLVVQEGWINYPIPLLASVVGGDGNEPDVSLLSSEKIETALAPLGVVNKDLTFAVCIQKLRTNKDDVAVVRAALSGIVGLIGKAKATYFDKSLTDDVLNGELSRLSYQTMSLIKDILDCYSASGAMLDEQRYRFKVRLLEAVLLQQPTETQVLAGNSWTSLLASIQASQQANKALGNVSNSVSNKNLSTGVVVSKEEVYRRLVEVTKLKSHALTKDLAAKWQGFVTGIATNSSGNDQESFYGMLTVLLEANLFDTWLHKFFAVAYDSNPNSCLFNLLQTFNASKTFLEAMIQRLKTLESLDLKAIASPKAFKSVWESFYNDQVVYFTTPYVQKYASGEKGFLNDLRDGSELQKLACLVLMEKFITVFDGAIKMVEESGEFAVSTAADIQLDKNFLVGSSGSYGSPSVAKQWDDSIKTFWASPAGGKLVTATIGEGNKIFAVKVLLFFYLNTLELWWNEVAPENSYYSSQKVALVTSIAGYMEITIKEAFTKLKQLFFGEGWNSVYGGLILPDLFRTNNEDSVKPTASFNVAEATIGSKATFARACPKSLEDLFTFTHQSMLAVLAALYKEYGLRIDNKMPLLVTEAQRKILACTSTQTTALPSLQGINFSNGTLELVYNWPQNNHSATITASYLVKKIAGTAEKNRVLHLSINMFGADHYGRWSRIADYIQLKSRIDKLPLYSTLLKEKGIEFIWEIQESAANYSAVITSVINCMEIVSKIAGSFSVTTGNYNEISRYLSPKLTPSERVNAQDGRKNLIAMSAEEERIAWGLTEVFSEANEYSLQESKEESKQETDYSPEIVKNMLTIATKLSDQTSEYYAKSIILLHKLRYAPDIGGSVKPANYYGLTKDTYTSKIATAHLTEYRGYIATMISFILRKILADGALRYADDADVQKAGSEFVERGLPFLLDDTAYQTAGVELLTAIMERGSAQFKAIIQPIVATWETSNPTVYDLVRDIDGIEHAAS